MERGADPELRIPTPGAPGPRTLTVAPEESWDLEALWRFRVLAWVGEPPDTLVFDLSRLRSLDPGALLLLHGELVALSARGTRIRFRGLRARLRRQLRRHPILRFLTEDDELFTDPDLEASGFRPSRH